MSRRPQSRWLLRSIATRLLCHKAPGDELDAEQSVPLPAGGSVSRALQERDVPGFTEAEKALVKRVKAAIQSGDQNLLFAADVDGHTLVHEAADYGLVDLVLQLIKAGGKKPLTRMGGLCFTTPHYMLVWRRRGC